MYSEDFVKDAMMAAFRVSENLFYVRPSEWELLQKQFVDRYIKASRNLNSIRHSGDLSGDVDGVLAGEFDEPDEI